MGKKDRLLTNKAARQMSEDELTKMLCDYYRKVNSRSSLTLEEEVSLRNVVKAIRGNEVSWSRMEDEIADGWDALENTVRDFWGPL